MKRAAALLLSILFGAALFALIWPYQHDMYIGALHTAACVLLNGGSCLLFSVMLYHKLTGSGWLAGLGIYLWFLILLGIGHGVFAFMNWGSWLCIALSATALILLFMDWHKAKSLN